MVDIYDRFRFQTAWSETSITVVDFISKTSIDLKIYDWFRFQTTHFEL